MEQSINKLPDLPLFIIFNYVNIFDLIKLKRINKRFYSLINRIKFKELIIKGRNSDYFDAEMNFWYGNRSINLKNTIQEKFLNPNNCLLFELESFRNQFIDLKYLKIFSTDQDRFVYFDLEILNDYEKLEILELSGSPLGCGIDPKFIAHLKLKNLKIFVIKYIDYHIEIECPNLEFLKCHFLNDFIKINHPESLIELDVSGNENSLNKFCNLEIYKCDDFKNEILESNNLPNSLKELHIYCDSEHVIYSEYLSINSFNQLRSTLRRRPNLCIYFKSIQLKYENLYDQYNFDKKEFEDFDLFSTNWSSLENRIVWKTKIDYNNLIRSFNYKIPKNFNTIFFNIQECIITSPIDQDQLILFLGNCLNLSKLEFNNPQLDQQFYEKLSDFAFNLQIFELNENKIKLNFNFLTKFKIIELIKINQSLSFELIENILKDCEFIDNLNFKLSKINDKEISIFFAKLNKNEKLFNLNYDDNEKCMINVKEIIDLLIKLVNLKKRSRIINEKFKKIKIRKIE